MNGPPRPPTVKPAEPSRIKFISDRRSMSGTKASAEEAWRANGNLLMTPICVRRIRDCLVAVNACPLGSSSSVIMNTMVFMLQDMKFVGILHISH